MVCTADSRKVFFFFFFASAAVDDSVDPMAMQVVRAAGAGESEWAERTSL